MHTTLRRRSRGCAIAANRRLAPSDRRKRLPRRAGNDYCELDDLIRTFDALLMIARAGSGQARDNMTEFDAAQIARDVGEPHGAPVKGAGIEGRVRGNRELVSQALANLIDNAIKYAAPSSNANGVASDAVNGAPAEIVVGGGQRRRAHRAERGRSRPSAPPEADGRVVERFVRLEQQPSEPGSGLGLSLASAVARLHGGELKLEEIIWARAACCRGAEGDGDETACGRSRAGNAADDWFSRRLGGPLPASSPRSAGACRHGSQVSLRRRHRQFWSATIRRSRRCSTALPERRRFFGTSFKLTPRALCAVVIRMTRWQPSSPPRAARPLQRRRRPRRLRILRRMKAEAALLLLLPISELPVSRTMSPPR